MKTRDTHLLIMLLALWPGFTAVAQIVSNDPNLPVVYPGGIYRATNQNPATFSGPGLTIVLTNLELRVSVVEFRQFFGADEVGSFQVNQFGLVNVNGGPFLNAQGSGPAQTVTHAKLGNTTGTFSTEMLSLSVSGTSPFGPYMLRESPTLPSLGQTTITYLGSGHYQIESFFDVFTQLSLDGGATWLPDSQGPARVMLLPVSNSPVIVTEPQSQSVAPGSNATFNVVATGTAPLNYQWRFNGTNISSATVSSYMVTNAQPTDAGGYSVVVSNTAGSVISSVAMLTVTPLAIRWFTLDGGGGTSTGAVFAVRGTIGQHDAGRLTNGTSVLNGGFWAVVQTPGAPLLSIARTTTNTVAVFWPSPSTGFVLQQNTNDVSSVNWSNAPGAIDDNGTTKTLVVNPPIENRFYRLFKP